MRTWLVLVMLVAGCESQKDHKALGTEREAPTALPHATARPGPSGAPTFNVLPPGAWPTSSAAPPGHDAGAPVDGGRR